MSGLTKEQIDQIRRDITEFNYLDPRLIIALCDMAYERNRLKEEVEQDGAFRFYMHDWLSRQECRCDPEHYAATPPMMWPEWISCIVAKHVEAAEAERDGLAARVKELERRLTLARNTINRSHDYEEGVADGSVDAFQECERIARETAKSFREKSAREEGSAVLIDMRNDNAHGAERVAEAIAHQRKELESKP